MDRALARARISPSPSVSFSASLSFRTCSPKQRREEELATAQTARDDSLVSQQTAHLTLTKQQEVLSDLNEKMKTKDEAVIMQRVEVNRPVLAALNGALKPEVRLDSRASRRRRRCRDRSLLTHTPRVLHRPPAPSLPLPQVRTRLELALMTIIAAEKDALHRELRALCRKVGEPLPDATHVTPRLRSKSDAAAKEKGGRNRSASTMAAEASAAEATAEAAALEAGADELAAAAAVAAEAEEGAAAEDGDAVLSAALVAGVAGQRWAAADLEEAVAALTEQIDAAVEAEEYDAAEELEEARVAKAAALSAAQRVVRRACEAYERALARAAELSAKIDDLAAAVDAAIEGEDYDAADTIEEERIVEAAALAATREAIEAFEALREAEAARDSVSSDVSAAKAVGGAAAVDPAAPVSAFGFVDAAASAEPAAAASTDGTSELMSGDAAAPEEVAEGGGAELTGADLIAKVEEIEAKVAAFAEEINLAVDTEDYELAETLEAERSAMEATLAIFKAELPDAAEDKAATGAGSGFSFLEPAPAHERTDSGFSFVEPAAAPVPAALAADEVPDAESDAASRGRTDSGFEFADPAAPVVAEEQAPPVEESSGFSFVAENVPVEVAENVPAEVAENVPVEESSGFSFVAADEPDFPGVGGAADGATSASAFAFVAAEEPDLDGGIGGAAEEADAPSVEEPASAFAFVAAEKPGVAAVDESASAFAFVAAEESGATTESVTEDAAADADPHGANDFEEEVGEANAAAAAAEEAHFDKGETVLYVTSKETGETAEAEIMKVHIDDPEEKYYTIVCMGREKQTVGSRMRRRTAAEEEAAAVAAAGAAGAEAVEEMPDLSGIGAPDASAEVAPVSAFGFVAADAAAEAEGETAPVSAFDFVASTPAPAPAADAAAEADAAAVPAAPAAASGFGFM